MTLARTIPLLMVILLVAPLTVAGSQNDAGTGGDAGNTRATATPIAYGAYSGYIASQDSDWYRAPGATQPACAVATVRPFENPQSVAFGLERGASATLTTARILAGQSRTLAMAGTSYTGAVLGVAPLPNEPQQGDPARPGPYQFTIATVGPSDRATRDALTGADVGGTPLDAGSASNGCIQGHLDPLSRLGGDNADAYRLVAAPGDVITFSLAAAQGAPIGLTLTDANGVALSSIGVDGISSYSTSSGGVFYLTAARSTMVSAESIAYIIGVIVGPEPPSCTPNC